ncbi:MAG TPA: hypothetical protein ENL27_01930 [Candidatus Parcubacteria bacterium]|nr:hypothetical protein [Candidatus Parcubacteria bacterium]
MKKEENKLSQKEFEKYKAKYQALLRFTIVFFSFGFFFPGFFLISLFLFILMIKTVPPEVRTRIIAEMEKSQQKTKTSRKENHLEPVLANQAQNNRLVFVEREPKKISVYDSYLESLRTEGPRIEKRQRYLHIALNSTLKEARKIISKIPTRKNIILEVGTPLIKTYGEDAISQIKYWTEGLYILADAKTSDLAEREVKMAKDAGASGITCLGTAPIETIDAFLESCEKYKIDSFLDMMNIENPLLVLKKLKKIPKVVMLHRGVDETEKNKEKVIPYYQIKQIKGSYNTLIAVAGGDTEREIQSAIFNDADIVVLWKDFYKYSPKTPERITKLLKKINKRESSLEIKTSYSLEYSGL